MSFPPLKQFHRRLLSLLTAVLSSDFLHYIYDAMREACSLKTEEIKERVTSLIEIVRTRMV